MLVNSWRVGLNPQKWITFTRIFFIGISDNRWEVLNKDAQLKKALVTMGVDEKKYSDHSFRIGMATIVTACAIQDSLVRYLVTGKEILCKVCITKVSLIK